jgi:hypothetical protein
MTNRTPLEQLHAEYQELGRLDPAMLTADQRLSLRYFQAEIAAPEGARVIAVGTDRVSRWIRNLIDLEHFIRRERRWPRENNRLPATGFAPNEQLLASWVRTERRPATAPRRCTYQRRRLDCVAGYSLHPLDARWDTRLGAYRAFTITEHRAPRLRSADPHERRAARWAAKQRLRYRQGNLPQRRISALDQLPFWAWGQRG